MNKRLPDKDIDSIFKDAIDPVETDPSDKFWSRTYEDIIRRENNVYSEQIRRWKAISYTLGAAVILLAFYTFYIHSKISNIEKQITEVEKKQAIAAGNESINGAVIINPPNKTTAQLNINKQAITPNHESGQAITVTRKNYKVESASANNYATITNTNINAEHNEPEALTRMISNNSNPGGNNVGTEKNPLNSSSYGFGDKTLPGNYYTQNNISNVSKDNNSSVQASLPLDSSLTVKNEKPAITLQKDTTPTLADNKNGADSLNPIAQTGKTAGSKTRLLLSHLYVSVFFSPELTDDIINDNNPSGNLIVNNIKASEEGGITFTTGLKVGYDLTKHWSILTGVNYHISSFSILPTEINAQWQGNENSYSLITSDGTVEMPNSILQYTKGSLIKASGNSSVAYIGVPLQVRYDVLPGSNLDYYIEAGFAANILLQTQTNINWETTSYGSSCQIADCEGLEREFFVYNMGIGISYKIKRGFSIFVEPGMQGPITPISKDEPVTTYPYFLDLTIGLISHF